MFSQHAQNRSFVAFTTSKFPHSASHPYRSYLVKIDYRDLCIWVWITNLWDWRNLNQVYALLLSYTCGVFADFARLGPPSKRVRREVRIHAPYSDAFLCQLTSRVWQVNFQGPGSLPTGSTLAQDVTYNFVGNEFLLSQSRCWIKLYNPVRLSLLFSLLFWWVSFSL